jgi:DNA-binding MarR family transcriptional regulator
VTCCIIGFAVKIFRRVKQVKSGYAPRVTGSRRDVASRLNSATIHLVRALRQIGPAGVAAEHRSALTAVVFSGPLSIGALARREGVGAPAMTKTVRALEERRLVTRQQDRKDGRVVQVTATRAGKELILRGRDERVARIGRTLAKFSKADTARLDAAVGILERLVADLEGNDR